MSALDIKLMNSNKIEIHTQLEILKYLSGKDVNGKPSGEGIPIDIILLPDLILDIRKYNLENQNLELKSLAIGGRSGRVSCILAHLIDLYDGIYNPHLVTKTGNLGKLILDNEFYSKDSLHESEKLRKHIFERIGEPRITIWNKPYGDFNTRQSSEIYELSDDDLKKDYFLNLDLKRSRIIYLSSIKTPNFKRILYYLVNELNISSGKIFIDCTRSIIDNLKELITIVSGKDFNRKAIEGIIISENEKNLFEKHTVKYIDIFKKLHISILYYSNDVIIYFDKEGLPTEIKINVPFDNEDIPERFKAGFILAYSLKATVNNLFNEISAEQKEFVSTFINNSQIYWNDEPLKKMIYYGISIAQVEPNGSGNCDLRLLFKNENTFFPVNNFHPIKIETKDIAINSTHIVINNESVTNLVRLSGYRRNNRLMNKDVLKRIHENCKNNPNCKYYKTNCKYTIPPESEPHPYTVLMIDLDGTLLNSRLERDRGLERALKIINSKLNLNSPADNFFEDYIYNQWPLFKQMGKGDFRQEWNHKGWYITYILLMQNRNNTLFDRIHKEYTNIKEPKKNPDKINALLQNANLINDFNNFNNLYELIEREHIELIELAQHEFSSVHMYAFKEAFDFLKSLKETGIYNLYIVSEGNSETQWFKLKSTGLDEFFPRKKVLTTDDAAKPNKQIADLKKEKAIIESRLKEIKLADKNLSRVNGDYSDFKRRITAKIKDKTKSVDSKSRNDILNSLSDEAKKYEEDHFIQEQMQINLTQKLYKKRQKTVNFVGKVITRLSSKGGIAFYATVIRAILNNPDSPLDSLNDFGQLVDMELPKKPFRFAMIGDRQDNDIEPVSKLLHKDYILTMRILSGTYFNEAAVKDNYDNNPNFIIHTLAQAKALLLSEKIWDHTFCTYDPPFFCWKVEFDVSKRDKIPEDNEIFNPTTVFLSVGLDVILCGIQMPSFVFTLTNKICRKILKEFIILNPNINLIFILDEYDLLNTKEFNKDVLKRKTRILTALVIDTNLGYGNLSTRRNEILKRLSDTLDYFQNNNINNPESDEIKKAIEILKN